MHHFVPPVPASRPACIAHPARQTALVSLMGASALLSGCFLQPGTFEAEMMVRADGGFTFSYEGEIVMAGLGDLSDMAAMADQSGGAEPCTDDTTGEERPCTDAELAKQAEDRAQGEAMMQAMLGGADMSDPESAAQLAASLTRQKGWNRVDYVEEGVFSVSFAIESVLAHDFDFPTIEGMPLNSAFVTARLRNDDRVRIEAPGFSGQGGAANPFAAMMMGMAGAFGAGDNGAEGAAPSATRPIRGTFRLTSDAAILANNTDEGPVQSAAGQVLEWRISPTTNAAPTALLQLMP